MPFGVALSWGAIGGAKNVKEVNFIMDLTKEIGPTGGIVGPEFRKNDAQEFKPRYTVSLYTFLKRFQAPSVINYLSMDVEGAEGFIVKPCFEKAASEYTIRSISLLSDRLTTWLLFLKHIRITNCLISTGAIHCGSIVPLKRRPREILQRVQMTSPR